MVKNLNQPFFSHFEESEQYSSDTKTGGLFTKYINQFLKLKQEASGWPDWCTNDELKNKYLKDYYDHEGIQLEGDKILKNPALRSVAKYMLNSFW